MLKARKREELLWFPSFPSQSKVRAMNHPHCPYRIPPPQSKYCRRANCSWATGLENQASALYSLQVTYLKSVSFTKADLFATVTFFLMLFNVYSQIWTEAKILFYSYNLRLLTSLPNSQSMFFLARAGLLSSWPLMALMMVWTNGMRSESSTWHKHGPVSLHTW